MAETTRTDALHTTRQHGAEFVSMEHAHRDVSLLLAMIKWLEECCGESLEADDRALVDEIATDYGAPRWHSDH